MIWAIVAVLAALVVGFLFAALINGDIAEENERLRMALRRRAAEAHEQRESTARLLAELQREKLRSAQLELADYRRRSTVGYPV